MSQSKSFQILYFAAIRELVSCEGQSIAWPLPKGPPSVQELSEYLVQIYPQLRGQLSSVRFAINEEFVELSALIHAGDVVALIPPVSGG